jgi:hypothetical protein
MPNITYTVYPPGCFANTRPDKWKCEVRDGGWIADYKLFETQAQAEKWGKEHTGGTTPEALFLIAEMVKRWANK